MSDPPAERPWALVTGASAGIGAAIARELASRGYNLALTARRRERLEALARELGEAHGCACAVLVADLADPAAPAALSAELRGRGIVVEMLVNNAGYGVPGFYHRTDWKAQADFLQVLVTAMCELTHRLLPAMRERGRGHIINVASLAGLIPGSSGNTLYAGAKAFAIKFSQSLALENRDRGVRVLALCPGFTYSEFHDVTGARSIVSKLPKYMWMTAEEVARQGVDAALRGDVVYVNGRVNRLIKFIAKHLPDRMALALVARRSRDFRAQE
jgi:short-subunit dehydrogenase